MRFITEVIDGSLIVSNRRKTELLSELQERGYKPFPSKPLVQKEQSEESDNVFDFVLFKTVAN